MKFLIRLWYWFLGLFRKRKPIIPTEPPYDPNVLKIDLWIRFDNNPHKQINISKMLSRVQPRTYHLFDMTADCLQLMIREVIKALETERLQRWL